MSGDSEPRLARSPPRAETPQRVADACLLWIDTRAGTDVMSHVRADLFRPTRVPRARVIFGFAPRVSFPARVSPLPVPAPADLRRLREGAPGVHGIHRAEHRVLGQSRWRYARSHRPCLARPDARPSFQTRANESLTRPRKRHRASRAHRERARVARRDAHPFRSPFRERPRRSHQIPRLSAWR